MERAARPPVSALRRRLLQAAQTITTPLLADDYLGLINPRWSTREATATIAGIDRETADVLTVRLRPDRGFAGFGPGQYLRLGTEIDGVRHWRAYTLTSDPSDPLLAVTAKRVEGGRVSSWLHDRARIGDRVWLGVVEGAFVLPAWATGPLLFVSAGSGVTPVRALLRELARRRALRDVVHVHCCRDADDAVFGAELRALAAREPGYTLVEHHSRAAGRLDFDGLAAHVADWRERDAWLCAPRPLLDALLAGWAAGGGDVARVRTERFQPVIGLGGDAKGGSGGTVTFTRTGAAASCAEGVSVLVGGEAAGAALPFGCRMGICNTCVGRLTAGQVRDLRTGAVHDAHGQYVRTCVSAPEGAAEIEL